MALTTVLRTNVLHCEQGWLGRTTTVPGTHPFFSKKDHSKRMVVDSRKINALLKPIITLLPKIDDLLQQISALNPVYMTMCDFFKGFWQLSLTKRSKKITAFVSPKTGVSYCHLTLPMGLHSSPAAFIQMISSF